jgi:hypothetical protein
MTYKHIIAIVIVCLTVIFAIAMIVGGSGQEIPVTTPQVKDQVHKDIVEDSYKNMFVEACTENATHSYCTCTWEHMENAMGREAMLNMIINLDGEEMTQEMYDAAYDCMAREI